MVKNMDRKNIKWKAKWKWVESVTIDLKTGKSKNKYFIPKTLEEERKLKVQFDEQMDQAFDVLFAKIM